MKKALYLLLCVLPISCSFSHESVIRAKKLVENLYQSRDREIPGTPMDFNHNTKIVLQFPEKHIDSISQKCFLNTHQTGTTQGVLNSAYRAKIEDEILGENLAQDHLLRAKYAYLKFIKNSSPNFATNFDPLYGNVFAEIKEDVKQRSTFSAGDSLALSRLVDHKKIAHTFKLKKDPGFKRDGEYWEVQIWGRLCFSDVERFLVNCTGISKVSAAAVEKLQETGIPVVECGKVY